MWIDNRVLHLKVAGKHEVPPDTITSDERSHSQDRGMGERARAQRSEPHHETDADTMQFSIHGFMDTRRRHER